MASTIKCSPRAFRLSELKYYCDFEIEDVVWFKAPVIIV